MEGCAIAYRRNETAEKLCYVFLIFLLGCLVGWVYEEIFYWITEGLLRNRGGSCTAPGCPSTALERWESTP